MPYALLIIPILTFLIFVHELGHYMTAKRAGMKVEEFGIGLPPRLWGIRRGETMWSINWIPFGGYVKVLGEDGNDISPRSMQAKTVGQRALFITAGSIMNFLTAFVLIAVLLAAQGEPSSHVYVTDVVDGSPAAEAGWQPGDRFVEVAGREVSSSGDMIDETESHVGEPMEVVVERGVELVTTSIVPRVDPPPDQGRTGIRLSSALVSKVEVDNVPAGSAAEAAGLQPGDVIVSVNDIEVTDSLVYQIELEQSANQTADIVVNRDGQLQALQAQVPVQDQRVADPLGGELVGVVQFERTPILRVIPDSVSTFFEYLKRMGEGFLLLVQGEVPFSEVAGPIGMGQLTSEIVTESDVPTWVALVNLTIILSLNLAILNLLPLPALDGGRLVFVILEVLRRGKRVAPEKEGLVHFVGLVILLTFMVAVAFMDVDRIISGNSLLQ